MRVLKSRLLHGTSQRFCKCFPLILSCITISSKLRLNTFIGHAFAFGFFLNIPRFLAKIAEKNTESALPPVVLDAVHLVALATVQGHQSTDAESQILSRLVGSLSTALSGIHPSQLLYVLQAEVLLSNYFFHHDRRLEGGYHVTAAVSIVLASNLHQTHDHRNPTPASVSEPYQLPPPADSIVHGERVNAFWTVFCLDRCWSVALGSQSALARADFVTSQISTPWPLDMGDYERVRSVHRDVEQWADDSPLY